MTIPECTDLRIEAENKIVEILNELEVKSKCKVKTIEFSKVVEEGFGTDKEIEVHRFVNITLVIQ